MWVLIIGVGVSIVFWLLVRLGIHYSESKNVLVATYDGECYYVKSLKSSFGKDRITLLRCDVDSNNAKVTVVDNGCICVKIGDVSFCNLLNHKLCYVGDSIEG